MTCAVRKILQKLYVLRSYVRESSRYFYTHCYETDFYGSWFDRKDPDNISTKKKSAPFSLQVSPARWTFVFDELSFHECMLHNGWILGNLPQVWQASRWAPLPQDKAPWRLLLLRIRTSGSTARSRSLLRRNGIGHDRCNNVSPHIPPLLTQIVLSSSYYIYVYITLLSKKTICYCFMFCIHAALQDQHIW